MDGEEHNREQRLRRMVAHGGRHRLEKCRLRNSGVYGHGLYRFSGSFPPAGLSRPTTKWLLAMDAVALLSFASRVRDGTDATILDPVK